MRGNYLFIWKDTADEDGSICGIYEHSIYGKNLAHAIKNFTFFHGEIGPRKYGVTREITSITLER